MACIKSYNSHLTSFFISALCNSIYSSQFKHSVAIFKRTDTVPTPCNEIETVRNSRFLIETKRREKRKLDFSPPVLLVKRKLDFSPTVLLLNITKSFRLLHIPTNHIALLDDHVCVLRYFVI